MNDELNGADAIRFIETRLTKVRTDFDTWEVEYLDALTGEKWLLDYPQSELQGGGSPRLRRIR